MNCNYCGRVATSWQRGVLVESIPPKGVTELTCGSCVARGALRRLKEMPEPDPVNTDMDLKVFRSEVGLRGVDLALYLDVHKAMVSQVENGKKEMPIAWVEKIKKLTDPTFASKWAKS